MVLGARFRLGTGLGVLALLSGLRLLVTVCARRIRVRTSLARLGSDGRRPLHASDRPLPNPAHTRGTDRPRGESGCGHCLARCARSVPRPRQLVEERDRSTGRKRARRRQRPRQREYPCDPGLYAKHAPRWRSIPRWFQRRRCPDLRYSRSLSRLLGPRRWPELRRSDAGCSGAVAWIRATPLKSGDSTMAKRLRLPGASRSVLLRSGRTFAASISASLGE
jgi:hypothetical protein